jgi:hypothetical protein
MKLQRTIALIAGVILAGCMETGDEAAELDLEEETSTTEQGSWTSWVNLSSPVGTGYVRACKTSTRINWEFGYNSYTTAQTWGDGIGLLQSNIAGQGWGQKYRTRAGTTFSIALGSNNHFWVMHWNIGSLPNC